MIDIVFIVFIVVVVVYLLTYLASCILSVHNYKSSIPKRKVPQLFHTVQCNVEVRSTRTVLTYVAITVTAVVLLVTQYVLPYNNDNEVRQMIANEYDCNIISGELYVFLPRSVKDLIYEVNVFNEITLDCARQVQEIRNSGRKLTREEASIMSSELTNKVVEQNNVLRTKVMILILVYVLFRVTHIQYDITNLTIVDYILYIKHKEEIGKYSYL